MSQWSLLWIETYWCILSFMYLNAHIFPQIRKGLCQYCFIKTFCSFLSSSGIHVMKILFHLMESFKSHRLSSFLFILFFFFSLWLDNFKWIIIEYTDSSTWLSLLLKHSVAFVFLSFMDVFFSSKIVWFFLYVFYFSWNLFCSCIVFLILLDCLSVLSYSCLSWLWLIILNYLSGNPFISISLGSVLKVYCIALVLSCFSDSLWALLPSRVVSHSKKLLPLAKFMDFDKSPVSEIWRVLLFWD